MNTMKYLISFTSWFAIITILVVFLNLSYLLETGGLSVIFLMLWALLLSVFGSKFYFFPCDLFMFVISILTTSRYDQNHIKWAAWRK
jgi:hypothetical protein